MKKEVRERTTNYTVYIALDGQEFNDEDACKKYEATCEGVINGNLAKHRIGKGFSYDNIPNAYYFSGEDYFELYDIADEDALDHLNMYLKSHNWTTAVQDGIYTKEFVEANHYNEAMIGQPKYKWEFVPYGKEFIGKRVLIGGYYYDNEINLVETEDSLMRQFRDMVNFMFHPVDKDGKEL